jgi:hypothetical protein
MDINYAAVAAVAAAALCRHRHIEANRRPGVLPGIEEALKRVCQANRVMADCVMADDAAARRLRAEMADAAAAKERACAEMRGMWYVHDVVVASKADAADAAARRAAKAAARRAAARRLRAARRAARRAAKAEAEAEAEEWGEPSAEAVAAADAAVLGSELTDMANFVAGNDAPAVLRWMATGDASQLPAGMTVTYSQ